MSNRNRNYKGNKGYASKKDGKFKEGGANLQQRSNDDLNKTASLRRKIEMNALGGNSPGFYNKDERIAQDATNYSWNNAIGAKMPLSYRKSLTTGQQVTYQNYKDVDFDTEPEYALQATQAYPGIMTIDMVATYGQSDDYNSPLNMSTRQIVQSMWNANGRNPDYDAPDVMLYNCALDQIFSIHSHCTRALSCLPIYDARNKYLGESLVEAMGFDADDLKRNANDFRLALNMIAKKLESFPIPLDLDIITRHSTLYTTIYQDEPIMKTQFYIYKPAGYYQFAQMQGDDPDTVIGRLQYHSLGMKTKDGHLQEFGLRTTSEWLDILDGMVEALCDDSNLDMIKSDLLRYYGQTSMKLDQIPENVAPLIVYNPEVLTQIHNINFLPISSNYESGHPKCCFKDIVQVDEDNNYLGYLRSRVYTHLYGESYPDYPWIGNTNKITDFIAGRSVLMDIPVDLPNSDEILVGSRLKQVIDPTTQPLEENVSYQVTFGSEVVCHMHIYCTYNSEGLPPSAVEQPMDRPYKHVFPIACHWHNFFKAILPTLSLITTQSQFAKMLNDLSAQTAILGLYNQFNMAPLIELLEYRKSGSKEVFYHRGYSNDITNYTFLDYNDINNLHTTALLSEFGIKAAVKSN